MSKLLVCSRGLPGLSCVSALEDTSAGGCGVDGGGTCWVNYEAQNREIREACIDSIPSLRSIGALEDTGTKRSGIYSHRCRSRDSEGADRYKIVLRIFHAT